MEGKNFMSLKYSLTMTITSAELLLRLCAMFTIENGTK